MKFDIVTLDEAAFKDACMTLRAMVESSGYKPDVVIAVPRGGRYVAEAGWGDFARYEISFNRPDKRKIFKAATRSLLTVMPQFVCDALRRLDAYRLVRRSNHMDNAAIDLPTLPPNVGRILIVDDAVDSGATLRAVVGRLADAYPNVVIKSAVITVTAKTPIHMPEFMLYHNNTLVRMPWSIDAK